MSTLKWLQLAIFALPIGAKLIDAKPAYVNPPLGTLDDFVTPFALILVGLFAVVPWFIKSRRWASVTAYISLALCLVSFTFFVIHISNSIVRVDLPAGKVIQVSIGTDRTEFARKFFPNKTDTEMLKEEGFSEEAIHKLWTEPSILKARGKILGSYIGFLATANFLIGALARANDLESPI